MAVFNEPTQWGTSLVVNGDTNVIPQSTPAGSGALSFDDGFPQITQVPLGAGGIAPDRKDFNAVMKLLGDAVFFMQNGGFWSYNPLFDYAVGRVVLYTDGNLYKCIQANSATDPKTPTDSAYWLRITTTADSPTGEIKIWTSSSIPDGFLLCNGAAVSRTTYANLFAKIGTTYGTGDGSTTFNIPDLRDRYIIGANTNALGTKVAEQLPNITGNFRAVSGGPSDIFAGSFYFNDFGGHQMVTGSAGMRDSSVGFSAKRISSTYTDIGKVYPLSLAFNFIIKT